MKKQLLAGVCVLSLAACTGTKSETLADLFVRQDRAPLSAEQTIVPFETVDETVLPQVVETSVSEVVTTPEYEVKYVEIPTSDTSATPLVEQPSSVVPHQTYSLAKRSERYNDSSVNISPEVYSIVAGRVANKMLVDTPAIFAADKDAPLFIEDTVQIDRYLSNGGAVASAAAKEIILASKMFNVVDDKQNATFILKSRLDNQNTPEKPVIIFTMELFDANGQSKGQWSDTIRQILNDDESWW